MKEEIDEEVFMSLQIRHFPLIDIIIKIVFHIYTLIWRVNNYASRQGIGINRRNESTMIIM